MIDLGMVCSSCGKTTELWQGTFAKPLCYACFENRLKKKADRLPSEPKDIERMVFTPAEPSKKAGGASNAAPIPTTDVKICNPALSKDWLFDAWTAFFAGFVFGLIISMVVFRVVDLG